MRSYYNDTYRADIERLLIYADTDGDGLTDAEEAIIGTQRDNKDSDNDGVTDNAEYTPLDAANSIAIPANLQGESGLPLSWYQAANGDVIIIAHNTHETEQVVQIALQGLASNTRITIPLENRILKSSADGFSESLAGFERRLWRIAAVDAVDAALIIAPPANADPVMQPRDGRWEIDLARYAFDLSQADSLTWTIDSITGATVTAIINDGKLVITPLDVACGTSTIILSVVNSGGISTQFTLPVSSLGKAGNNLFINGDLETTGSSNYVLPEWNYYVWEGASEVVHDATHVFAGARSARLQSFSAGKSAIYQTLTLPAGRYRLSSMIASWDLRAGKWDLAGSLYIVIAGQEAISLPILKGDTDWQQLEGVFTVDQTAEVSLYFFIYGTGYLWVDNANLMALEPCATNSDTASDTASDPTPTSDDTPETNVDSDKDGLPDAWEKHYGLNPRDASDANTDLDGDGMSNLEEFTNNSDPTKDSVKPIISVPSNTVVLQAKSFKTKFAWDVLGKVSAEDALDGKLTATLTKVNGKAPKRRNNNSQLLLVAGKNLLTWTAADKAGNTIDVEQMLYVLPRANFSLNQSSNEGEELTVTVSLNGAAPVYPVVIPFTPAIQSI